METEEFRLRSLEVLAEAGISLPKSLPLLDDFQTRPLGDVVDRILCLNAVAAAAHGLSKDKALAWLLQEGVSGSLTDNERLFLHRDVESNYRYKIKVEAMWALAWVLSIIPSLDFWSNCESNFVRILPDINGNGSTSGLRDKSVLRPKEDIGFQCDLSYCLTWIIRERQMRDLQMPVGVTPYVVTERRRALDWVTCDGEWDSFALDT